MSSYIFLQNYWWMIISLMAGLLVFLMFVQGGQSFIFALPMNSAQKTMIINTMGRKWEFTFTTLVTFGGTFFASFPLFYASSFGGAYWVWMAILFSFIIQAIAYEYRSKPGNVLGKKTFEIFLFLNGSLGPFLIGTAVSTFFTGSNFSLNEMNQVQWQTSWHGLEALVNIQNLLLGFSVLFLTRVNGLLYIINTIDNEELIKRSGKALVINSIVFLPVFVSFTGLLISSCGFAIDRTTEIVVLEKSKYLHNFLQMPFVTVIFITGVAGILYGIGRSVFSKDSDGIWYSGSGTVLVVFSLLLIAGFNNTAFYPSFYSLQDSLTIRNASSSQFTLKTMMYVSFVIPIIFGYIWYAWKSINNKKIDENELKSDGHIY
jgi:cytochrome d ubiquinol oxidase subunit II